jgi:hypothetical protein
MGDSGVVEAGAIQECEEHGWMRDRTDLHARERALEVARAAILEVLGSIGDTCHECPE